MPLETVKSERVTTRLVGGGRARDTAAGTVIVNEPDRYSQHTEQTVRDTARPGELTVVVTPVQTASPTPPATAGDRTVQDFGRHAPADRPAPLPGQPTTVAPRAGR